MVRPLKRIPLQYIKFTNSKYRRLHHVIVVRPLKRIPLQYIKFTNSKVGCFLFYVTKIDQDAKKSKRSFTGQHSDTIVLPQSYNWREPVSPGLSSNLAYITTWSPCSKQLCCCYFLLHSTLSQKSPAGNKPTINPW